MPQTPATVPPLPSSVRRLRSGPLASGVPRISNTTNPSNFAPGARRAPTSRLGGTPVGAAQHRPTSANAIPGSSRGRGRSAIADLMPTAAITGLKTAPVRRVGGTSTGIGGASKTTPLPPPPPPPRSPLDDVNIGDDDFPQEEDDSSEASLTPTEDGDEFIEDGLGGSSFLGEGRHPQGFGALDPGLAGILQRPRPVASNIPSRHQPPRAAAQPPKACMDKSLEGYVIVESDGSGEP